MTTDRSDLMSSRTVRSSLSYSGILAHRGYMVKSEDIVSDSRLEELANMDEGELAKYLSTKPEEEREAIRL
eukprot:CAMPEP_0206260940 /NCGR_PEP_ID=MMETSP0047_2-20121206/27371_1 /ASSEMBLY_ACC=CAM_ASM_000192 /TAXON_ID=195065 /ORGANISM="Chroomonas mesostigmatica_cf, Strain CCMP1168" /LENGTH=70 /DNA_ID=CAMNT_0053688085 /DNA_START=104 /DNA_END=313 /DNA_ORIENTATION=-